jgi:hypothetical protein
VVVPVEPALPADSDGSLARPFIGVGAETIMTGSPAPDACGAAVPIGGNVCAAATPVIIARAVVATSQNLNTVSPPGACQPMAFARSFRRLKMTQR